MNKICNNEFQLANDLAQIKHSARPQGTLAVPANRRDAAHIQT